MPPGIQADIPLRLNPIVVRAKAPRISKTPLLSIHNIVIGNKQELKNINTLQLRVSVLNAVHRIIVHISVKRRPRLPLEVFDMGFHLFLELG